MYRTCLIDCVWISIDIPWSILFNVWISIANVWCCYGGSEYHLNSAEIHLIYSWSFGNIWFSFGQTQYQIQMSEICLSKLNIIYKYLNFISKCLKTTWKRCSLTTLPYLITDKKRKAIECTKVQGILIKIILGTKLCRLISLYLTIPSQNWMVRLGE